MFDQIQNRPVSRSRGTRLSVESLSKVFTQGSSDNFRVLNNVSFTVAAGEFAAIIGPSGCGKSTLLNIIAGLDDASSGAVSINHGRKHQFEHVTSEPVSGNQTGESRLGSVAYMHQRDLLLPWRSVLDNAALGLEVQGFARNVALQAAQALLPKFGLEGFENELPWRLSGGMRQRVALLRATLPNRGVLLLDEPFGALDAITRSDLQDWLAESLVRDNKVVLLVTHDIEEALILSDTIHIMSPRPGTIASSLVVDLPRPRHHEIATTQEFVDLRRNVMSILGGSCRNGSRE